MIRYATDFDDMEAQVEALGQNWLQRARRRTQKLIRLGRYYEKSSIWSEIKPILIRLQHNKCAFCERQLESVEYGTIEFDVEHFRPKGPVPSWPDPSRHPFAYDFETGEPSPLGYYWLAYDLRNYAICCKTCNTLLKANFFPILGLRAKCPANGDQLTSEQPLLCYPIGSLDCDPETLITFTATTAVPVAKSGYLRERARIIIDFFQLNRREQLHRERARMIVMLGQALIFLAQGHDAARVARSVVDRTTSREV